VICRLNDKSEIRDRLNTDRDWCIYALADLDDGMFEHCEWWAHGNALALVFRALAIRPILILGEAGVLLEHLPEASGYLNLKPAQFDAAARIYAYRERREMRRMILDNFTPLDGPTQLLSRTDCNDIQRLYATGDDGGIAFAPFQLDTGFFYGVRRGGELVGVAGVHVVSRNESVAGVGNIFTRHDCRGQGLARIVTSAVVSALRATGIQTIGLNVENTNTPAIRAYECLGFHTRFHYYEGVADRLTPIRGPSM
jgi:ribosomal protein S18 acetylase RimI-like enzyme